MVRSFEKSTYLDRIKIKQGGVPWFEQDIDNHVIKLTEQIGALHHISLSVEARHVRVIHLLLDHIEILRIVNEFQNSQDVLVIDGGRCLRARLHWLWHFDVSQGFFTFGVFSVGTEDLKEVFGSRSQDCFVSPKLTLKL